MMNLVLCTVVYGCVRRCTVLYKMRLLVVTILMLKKSNHDYEP